MRRWYVHGPAAHGNPSNTLGAAMTRACDPGVNPERDKTTHWPSDADSEATVDIPTQAGEYVQAFPTNATTGMRLSDLKCA
jgi:hypothetical protein